MPAIAQGTSGIGSYEHHDDATVNERTAALAAGIEAGLTFIDAAELYGGGFAEEVVGRAIASVRDKVFLSSKFTPREDIEPSLARSLEGSLKRLKTDCIDLYQIHWPNPMLDLERIMKALYDALSRGKIRFVGVSNFPLQYFKDAQTFFKGKIVSNQVEYNLLDRSIEKDMLPYATRNKITVLAYSPLNQGRILSGDVQWTTLESIAEKHGKTVSQVVLRWLVSHGPIIPVVRSRQIAHVRDNAAALDFDLSAEEIAQITAFSPEPVVPVALSSIRLVAPPYREAYSSLEEAMANKADLIPSPASLARTMKETGKVKPIRLTATADTSGNYLYDIDQYDAMDQVKKYWAWKMIHGDTAPIPAFILPKKE